MTAVTPKAANHDGLGPLASRYVDVEGMDWEPTQFPGVEWKVLLKDEESGLLCEYAVQRARSEMPARSEA